MPDILSTGVSGLRAAQRALDVISHNIANATTPGYSRQRVELATRQPEAFGGGYIGTGVTISGITRSYDDLLATQLRGASSALSSLDTFASKAQKLNNLFANTTTGVSAAMQRFINAVQGVSNDPTSTAARQVMLSEAEGLRQRLQTYEGRLEEINTEINAQVTAEAASITSLASQIARLNDQIMAARTSGHSPNDLLDSRDQLINDLSTRISVSVVPQENGAVNVFVGNGQSLVLGGNAGRLVAQPDPYIPTRMTVAFQSGSGTVDVASSLTGGSLGGLLEFRRDMLDPARNQLGQIAVAVADVANAQHRQGMDLNGNLGGDLFRIGAVEVLPRSGNNGLATVSVTRTDVGALPAQDYVLEFDGSSWSARDAVTGAALALTGSGATGTFTAPGQSIDIGGTPAGAIGGMQVAITDPARVAAAAPVRASASSGNAGSGVISAGEVRDASNGAITDTVEITFIDATHYSVNGSGSHTYAPGGEIELNGWSVRITGEPAAGDVFRVERNAGGVGDNRNALAMADMLGRGVLSGGAESINGAISRFVGGIGVATAQAQSSAEAQAIIAKDVQASMDAKSGVNLDEEAANMLRYQQAYQAAAQVIRITQTLFDTLIGATRR
jgi:flagellar hook-associated protein 1 FlgK